MIRIERPEWDIDGRLQRWETVSNDDNAQPWQIHIVGDALATVLRFLTGRVQSCETEHDVDFDIGRMTGVCRKCGAVVVIHGGVAAVVRRPRVLFG